MTFWDDCVVDVALNFNHGSRICGTSGPDILNFFNIIIIWLQIEFSDAGLGLDVFAVTSSSFFPQLMR